MREFRDHPSMSKSPSSGKRFTKRSGFSSCRIRPLRRLVQQLWRYYGGTPADRPSRASLRAWASEPKAGTSDDKFLDARANRPQMVRVPKVRRRERAGVIEFIK